MSGFINSYAAAIGARRSPAISPLGLLWWEIRCVGKHKKWIVLKLEIQIGNSG
jgi:hypothetical protein